MASELQIMISDEDVDRRINTRRAAQRAQAKCTSNYFCAWDLLDSLSNKTLSLEKVKVSDLPANMQKMDLEQRRKYVAEMQSKRACN